MDSKKTANISFVKAALIQAASKYSTVIMQMVITVILARLLSPEEYGVMAGVTIFTSLFVILADLGLGPAIIQYRGLDRDDYGSLLLFSCLLGILLAVLFGALGGPLSLFFRDSTYGTLCAWVSVSVVFNTLNMVPNGLLLKNKQFVTIGIRLFVTTLLGGICAITLATMHFGVMALVANVNVMAVSVFLWNVISVRHDLSFRDIHIFKSLRVVFKYSSFQAGASLVNYFARNLDHLVIGHMFDSTSLGLYDKAYKLTAYPITFVPQVLAGVIQPFLAEFQNDSRKLLDFYHKISLILAIFGSYVTFLFMLCSKEIMVIFYGTQWGIGSPLFAILSLSLFCQLLGNVTAPMLQSAGRTDLLFRQTSIATALVLMCMLVGAATGSLTWLTAGVAFGYCLQVITCVYYVEKKALGGSFGTYSRVVASPLIYGAVGYVCCLFIKWTFDLSSFPMWISLGVCFGFFSLVYFIGMFLCGDFKKVQILLHLRNR